MRFLIPWIAFVLFFTSCKPVEKVPAYLENVTDSSILRTVAIAEPRIQRNDLLSIQVYSSAIDRRVDEPYNLPTGGGASGEAATGGVLVDQSGNIQYPYIGSIQVEGLTKQQLSDIIRNKLVSDSALNDPVVIVRFLNYKVTILGEVGSTGTLTVPNERLTILEAIGLAGGITDDGKKESVRVIREANGVREMGIIDLTSKNVFESPYYNLMQNDLVIVDPSRRKIKAEERQETAQKLAFALSMITSVLFIYNSFR